MKRLRLLTFIICCSAVVYSQAPSFSLGSNSKYYDFERTFVTNDFKNTSQIRIGTYLTLGNFGLTNSSWIGSNAILDYTSYGDVGTLGNKNLFTPIWTSGTALIMELDFVDGNLEGYNHKWNQLSSRIDFLDFEQIWQIGKTTSYFLSNVGIGTNTPDSKLTVKGNIHAEEVKVDLSVPGPDYVFKEGYDLRTLEETQDYIKEHGHLPNIPSAMEMEENGIELGVMNMKLLEKIEELTLYVIGLKKENVKQQKVISQKDEKVIELEERLGKIEESLKNR